MEENHDAIWPPAPAQTSTDKVNSAKAGSLTGYAWLDAPLGFLAGLFGLTILLSLTYIVVDILTYVPNDVMERRILFLIWAAEICYGATRYWKIRRSLPTFGTALFVGSSLVVLFVLWYEQEWYPIIFFGASEFPRG